jgi:quercetin dioxygenase-like cupin family protein
MAKLFKLAEAKELGLPGRRALEIISGQRGSQSVTLRLVEIPVPEAGELERAPHHHSDFEECIYVLSGEGTTFAESGEYRLRPGDTLLMPAGENHVTRNTGEQPLFLLCFFPIADIRTGTREAGVSGAPSKQS